MAGGDYVFRSICKQSYIIAQKTRSPLTGDTGSNGRYVLMCIQLSLPRQGQVQGLPLHKNVSYLRAPNLNVISSPPSKFRMQISLYYMQTTTGLLHCYSFDPCKKQSFKHHNYELSYQVRMPTPPTYRTVTDGEGRTFKMPPYKPPSKVQSEKGEDGMYPFSTLEFNAVSYVSCF